MEKEEPEVEEDEVPAENGEAKAEEVLQASVSFCHVQFDQYSKRTKLIMFFSVLQKEAAAAEEADEAEEAEDKEDKAEEAEEQEEEEENDKAAE